MNQDFPNENIGIENNRSLDFIKKKTQIKSIIYIILCF